LSISAALSSATSAKNRSRRSSALTSARKSRYNATSSGRARRISTRSPPGTVLCNSLEPKSPLFGIGATSAPCASVIRSGFMPINGRKQTRDRYLFYPCVAALFDARIRRRCVSRSRDAEAALSWGGSSYYGVSPRRQLDDHIATHRLRRGAPRDQAAVRGTRECRDGALGLGRVARVDRAHLQPERWSRGLHRAELASSPGRRNKILKETHALHAGRDLLEQLLAISR